MKPLLCFACFLFCAGSWLCFIALWLSALLVVWWCVLHIHIYTIIAEIIWFFSHFQSYLCLPLAVVDKLTLCSCRLFANRSMTVSFERKKFDFTSTSHKSIYVYIRISAPIGTVQNKPQGLCNEIGFFPFGRRFKLQQEENEEEQN